MTAKSPSHFILLCGTLILALLFSGYGKSNSGSHSSLPGLDMENHYLSHSFPDKMTQRYCV